MPWRWGKMRRFLSWRILWFSFSAVLLRQWSWRHHPSCWLKYVVHGGCGGYLESCRLQGKKPPVPIAAKIMMPSLLCHGSQRAVPTQSLWRLVLSKLRDQCERFFDWCFLTKPCFGRSRVVCLWIKERHKTTKCQMLHWIELRNDIGCAGGELIGLELREASCGESFEMLSVIFEQQLARRRWCWCRGRDGAVKFRITITNTINVMDCLKVTFFSRTRVSRTQNQDNHVAVMNSPMVAPVSL